MEHLIEFAVFFAKAFVIIGGILLIIAFVAAQSMKDSAEIPQLEVENLNSTLNKHAETLREKIFDKKELKKLKKQEKTDKSKDASKSKIFVIDFEGDIKASAVKNLRTEVSAVLSVASSADQVVARVNSPGGMVHTYGLAAAQLMRIRNANIPLYVSVDKVAASGGYMMACTADKILAAPFAILGSIGVLAQVPNFHRFLKKHDIDYQEITAGDYKRTISMLGEITERGKEKFKEQIEDTHSLFKTFVKEHRPIVDIDTVSTGEPWFGKRALEKKLIDEIKTSDEYFFENREKYDIIKVKIAEKKKLGEKIAGTLGLILSQIQEKLQSSHY